MKVRDISEFLMSIPLKKPKGSLDARVTYHDPCHLRRGQGVWKHFEAVRAELESRLDVRLELARAAVRFSFGNGSAPGDVENILDALERVVARAGATPATGASAASARAS